MPTSPLEMMMMGGVKYAIEVNNCCKSGNHIEALSSPGR
jgi:hypothetical protein